MNAAGLVTAAAAGCIAAAINSAAGGGSFVSFPALVFLGVPPITANATNTTAMWIGQAGSIHTIDGDIDISADGSGNIDRFEGHLLANLPQMKADPPPMNVNVQTFHDKLARPRQ